MWLRTLLLAIVVLLLVRAVMRLMRGVMVGVGADRARGRTPAHPRAVKMVADPVCGTYVVPGKALEVARRGQTHYFCSENCRTRFLEG